MHSEKMISHSFGLSHADGWVSKIGQCVERQTRTVGCLVWCRENHLVMVILYFEVQELYFLHVELYPTTLLLPPFFPCAYSGATTCHFMSSECSCHILLHYKAVFLSVLKTKENVLLIFAQYLSFCESFPTT